MDKTSWTYSTSATRKPLFTNFRDNYKDYFLCTYTYTEIFGTKLCRKFRNKLSKKVKTAQREILTPLW